MDESSTYSIHSYTASDTTTIGYRQTGHGPSLILLHGGMKSSQDLTQLADLLSDTFTVYLPDRRGRGLSGPHGQNFSVDREVEDIQSLISLTETKYIFGLSSGALVALKTASATPTITKIVLYEPPFSIQRSVPIDWLPQYEAEINEGKIAAAAVTVMQGLGTEPTFNRLPRKALLPTMKLIMLLQKTSPTIRELTPTMHYDMQVIKEMSDALQDYAQLQAQVLLIHGSSSPAYFETAVLGLAGVLPHSTTKTLTGLGHDGPENDGQPKVVAEILRQFFQ